jgi:hypothetical protein
VDTWSRPRPTARRITHDEDGSRLRRRRPYGEEPEYGTVLAFTAGWYGAPSVLYVVWLLTLDSARQSIAGREFIGSLPWLLASIVVSLAVSAMLRWATVGWRVVALSFASAVIGAGLTTIAHSLTI